MWPAFQSFRLRDAIDIVVVAIVLYRVFVMFKETRAIQMLLGLAGLMVASFVARQFDLFSTSWLLDNFWSFWVLALIVLFQPELRRALTRLGESRLLPYSPPHDGAAFIRGDRVAAAGCFLPLSRNTQLGRNMGTRHRVGLRLAEETDAVVLIVSEESGHTSLAVDGQMESPLDQESLRRRLGDLFSLEEAPMPRRAAWWEPAREWLRK